MATKRRRATAARGEKTAKPQAKKKTGKKTEKVFENPLLPHAKLTAMYASMLECRLLDRRAASLSRNRARRPFAGREASLIAVMHNLLPQDWVSVGGSDPVMQLLRGAAPQKLWQCLRERKPVEDLGNGVLPGVEDVTARLAMAAGVAVACKTKEAVVVVYLDAAEARADWTGIFATAARLDLPIIFICQEDTRATTATKKLRDADWKRLGATSKRSGMTVIPVDGQDLIALYRVAQESIGRARMGLGPTVIWGMQWELEPQHTGPLRELERYLTARRLFTQAAKRRIAASFAKKLK